MQFPSKSYLEQLRRQYPKGTKLQLLSMRNEKYPVLPGTVGEVTHIDDAGSIHMRWENGSSLALIPEIVRYVTIQSQELQACILHNLLPAFSVDLAACYLLRLELIWLQRKGAGCQWQPLRSRSTDRGDSRDKARNYGGKHYEH